MGGPFEVQGTAESGEFWALVGGIMPTTANDGAKIIWKMSGNAGGNLSLLASDTEGNQIEPMWGPDAHGGSNWDRPGNEWGAGYVFPHAGCWKIQATSGGNTGQMWLAVAQATSANAATPVATPDTASQLYPLPATCSVTPLTGPQQGHWGYVARWWAGTGLTASAPPGPLYQNVGYDFRWELQARAPLALSGHSLDQPDQSIGLETDLNQSLSVVYPTEIVFPSPGCWMLHAQAGEQTLDVTVYVYPYDCLPADRRPPGSTDTCQIPGP